MKKTYILNLTYLALLVAAFILPRLFKDPAGGMAAAATSVMIFLFTFVLAGIVASYQFLYTYRRREAMPRMEVLLGLAPFAVSILACLTLFLFLRFQ